MELTRHGMSLDDLGRIAVERESVTVAAEVVDRVAAGAAAAQRLAGQRPVYGRSTGVGANRSVAVQDADGQLHRVLRSHATSLGEPREPVRVRAMVAVRIAQLARGGSGLSPVAFDGLVDGLNRDGLPMVLEGGSIGTGDLTALATIGVWLLDDPDGPRVRPGDALALISSNAAVLGDAALGMRGLHPLAAAALPIASLTLRAIRGNVEAFGPAVEDATPFPGAVQVCRRMRQLLADDGYDEQAARIQDPFGLRAMPQGHGVLFDALERAGSVVQAMVNAPSENPVFDEQHGVTHHGAFHAAYLAHAVESLLGALVQAAQLGMGRIVVLASPDLTGVPAFLADGTPGASGTMGVEFVAAAALARLRALATSASTGTVTISRGLEDHASFASVSVGNLLSAVDAYRELLACELFTAARALQLADRLPTWPELGPLRPGLGQVADRDLSPDLRTAADTVSGLVSRLAGP